MKTWLWELAVVWLVLIGVVAVTHGGPVEAVGTLAVLATFAHAQVAERMREREALKAKPDVHCHRWSTRYFFAKELLWLSYFVAHRSWSALVGVGVFLAYPLWRKWWRARHPISPKRVMFGRPTKVYIRLDRYGCEFLAAVSRNRADTTFVFTMGGDFLSGYAKPWRLQFFDDPQQPNVRFARFNVLGVGELQELPRHV